MSDKLVHWQNLCRLCGIILNSTSKGGGQGGNKGKLDSLQTIQSRLKYNEDKNNSILIE